MITPPMNNTCEKVSFTTNKFSTFVEESRTEYACYFREIRLESQTTHQRAHDSDGIIYIDPASQIVEGDIIAFESRYYKVQRLIRPHDLPNEPQTFLKAELTMTVLGVS